MLPKAVFKMMLDSRRSHAIANIWGPRVLMDVTIYATFHHGLHYLQD